MKAHLAQLVERHSNEVVVMGSNPIMSILSFC